MPYSPKDNEHWYRDKALVLLREYCSHLLSNSTQLEIVRVKLEKAIKEYEKYIHDHNTND